jgi:hypothetical protein
VQGQPLQQLVGYRRRRRKKEDTVRSGEAYSVHQYLGLHREGRGVGHLPHPQVPNLTSYDSGKAYCSQYHTPVHTVLRSRLTACGPSAVVPSRTNSLGNPKSMPYLAKSGLAWPGQQLENTHRYNQTFNPRLYSLRPSSRIPTPTPCEHALPVTYLYNQHVDLLHGLGLGKGVAHMHCPTGHG